MPTSMHCPHCGKKIGIPDNIMGKPLKCPSCQNVFSSQIMLPFAQPINEPAVRPHLKSLLPEPRSYIGTAVMLWGMTWLPFAIGTALLNAATQNQSFGQVFPSSLVGGFFFGVLFGLAMAFFIQGETATYEFENKKEFVSRLNIAVSQLGFNPATQTENFFTYKPSFQAGLAVGSISVQLEESQAVIVGPKMYVGKLLMRLRNS